MMNKDTLTKVLESIQTLEKKFQNSMEEVNQRVDDLTAWTQGRLKSRTPSPNCKNRVRGET